MKILYISKSYNYIYRNVGIAAVLVEDGVEQKVFLSRYLGISELNSELRALIDSLCNIKDDEIKDLCVLFPAGKIRKIGIDTILRSVDKGNDAEIRAMFAKHYKRLSECTLVMSDNKDTGHKDWFKIANKLARFALEGVTENGIGILNAIRSYPTLSFNELFRRMKVKNEKSAIEKEIRRREEVKNRRSGKFIFVVMMTNGTMTGVDFCTYDEKLAEEYVYHKDRWFAKNTRAIENYSFCMMKTGCANPKLVTEKMLDGTGITLEKFNEICAETVNGKYNRWYYVKSKIESIK